jgi:hypothetical protein
MNIPQLLGVEKDYDVQLNQTLTDNVGLRGFVIPSLTDDQIIALEPEMPNGTLWFNIDLAKLQVKTDSGVIETITSA